MSKRHRGQGHSNHGHQHEPGHGRNDQRTQHSGGAKQGTSAATGPNTLLIGAFVVLLVVAGIFVTRSAGAGAQNGSAPAGTVALQESGGVQTIDITADNAFSPSEIVAKAGVPIELRFGQGSGCAQAVKFPTLGIVQDITNGGGVVKLPALQKGRYDIYCQSDMDMGTLYVE